MDYEVAASALYKALNEEEPRKEESAKESEVNKNEVYIIGANLEQVCAALVNRTDSAHDPLNFFSFDYARKEAREIRFTANGQKIVAASKRGAAAGLYAKDLETRLRECGLTVRVTGEFPPESFRRIGS